MEGADWKLPVNNENRENACGREPDEPQSGARTPRCCQNAKLEAQRVSEIVKRQCVASHCDHPPTGSLAWSNALGKALSQRVMRSHFKLNLD